MQPVKFPEVNQTLAPSGKQYSADVVGVVGLPCFTNGEQCVSRWKLSWWERLAVLWRGHVWLAVLSGKTQPPVCITVDKTYFATEE